MDLRTPGGHEVAIIEPDVVELLGWDDYVIGQMTVARREDQGWRVFGLVRRTKTMRQIRGFQERIDEIAAELEQTNDPDGCLLIRSAVEGQWYVAMIDPGLDEGLGQ
jgi:hypothetical protein